MSVQTAEANKVGRAMRMSVSAAPSARPAKPIPLSPRERVLLDLLPKSGKPITSTDLVKRYYKHQITPLNARQIVVARMKSIMTKLKVNKDHRRVMQSKRRGPKPVSYWVEDIGG